MELCSVYGCEDMYGVATHVSFGGLTSTVAAQSTDQQGGPGDRVYDVEVSLNANHRNMFGYNIATYQWGKGCYQIELV